MAWSGGVASLNKANKAQIAKDCGGEQFYTDAIQPSDLAWWSASVFPGGESSCRCSIVCRTKMGDVIRPRAVIIERHMPPTGSRTGWARTVLCPRS